MQYDNLTVMLYNVEHMGKMFYKNSFAEAEIERINAFADIVYGIRPHILGIVEAAKKEWMHNLLIEKTVLSGLGYRVARSSFDRGMHELVFYYRDPVELVSLDAKIDFYDRWSEDIDNDGIEEIFQFEKPPLEGIFRHSGTGETFMVMLVATKSKGVFVSADILRYQALALANRKKLSAQAGRIRNRLDSIFTEDPDAKILIIGDLNDDPGADSYESLLGHSALEKIMGSVFEPEFIMHNALYHWTKDRALARELYTTEFHDPIVKNQAVHRCWIDHIMVSPGLRRGKGIRYAERSGMIADKTDMARKVSDHFPLYCRLEVEERD